MALNLAALSACGLKGALIAAPPGASAAAPLASESTQTAASAAAR